MGPARVGTFILQPCSSIRFNGSRDLLRRDGDTRPGHIDGLNEAGTATAGEVVGRDIAALQPVLHQGSGVGGHHLRGVCGKHDLVDVSRFEAGISKGAFRR